MRRQGIKTSVNVGISARDDDFLHHPQVEMVRLAALKPAARNARTHSKRQIGRIAESIARLGFNSPILVDDELVIICGHGRAEAARMLGMKQVPIIRLSHLTDAEKRLYALADNRIAEDAGWDREMLAVEFEELAVLLRDDDVGITVTGFEIAEIDGLFSDLEEARRDPADEVPAVDPARAVTRPGDLWVLGGHRVICGNACDQNVLRRLMDGSVAQMTFVDPPYNVRINGHVGGRGKIKHREFAVGSGEMTNAQFRKFLTKALGLCADHAADGSIAFVCMDWRHIEPLLAAGRSVYDELKNMIVWVKTSPGQGSFYRSQHELIFVFKKGDAPHINSFELGQHGRTRSNVWTHPGANSFRAGRMDELAMHPTVKPVALVADAMKDCSKRGALVLDSFLGSGTTLMAGERVGRRVRGVEIDPLYVDCSIRRWQRFTRKDAILAASGRTFEEIEAEREERERHAN